MQSEVRERGEEERVEETGWNAKAEAEARREKRRMKRIVAGEGEWLDWAFKAMASAVGISCFSRRIRN